MTSPKSITATVWLAILLAPGLLVAQDTTLVSDLPLLIIETGDLPIDASIKTNVSLKVVDNKEGANKIDGPVNGYEGTIGIEYRGSSSAWFPKKAFAVETRLDDGSNNNVELLGLPKENDWVLYAPYSDKSLIRNALSFELARRTGRYAPRGRFAELVLDGRYEGVYLVMEKVKRDGDRVDIARLSTGEDKGEISGGFIVKIDKFSGENVEGWDSKVRPYPSAPTVRFQYHYPKPSDIVDAQREHIRGMIETFENVLSSDNFADPATGYPSLINADSFIDFMLVNELSKNVDGYRLSTYLHQDSEAEDPRIHAGPIWDFNLAFGNADYYKGSVIQGWQFQWRNPEDSFANPFWWERLVEDKPFRDAVQERWSVLRSDAFSNESVMALADSLFDVLREPAQRNFKRWSVLGMYVWPNAFVGSSWDDEKTYLKQWIEDRLEWMDQNISDLVVEDETEEPGIAATSLATFPNPVSGTGTVEFKLKASGFAQVAIFDGLGRRVATLADGFLESGIHQIAVDSSAFPSGGLYFVRAQSAGVSITKGLAVIK